MDTAFCDSPHMYALVKEGQDPRYGMPTPEYVEEAIRYFEKHAKKFVPEDRHIFAHNVLHRAAEMGVAVNSPILEKYAGTTYNRALDAHLSLRKSLTNSPTYKLAYEKIAAQRNELNPKEFAENLMVLDKHAGVDKYYDTKVADAYAATFGVQKKAVDNIVELVKDKRPVLESYFGKAMVDGLEKEGTAAYEALPDDAKEIIQSISTGAIS